VHTALERKEPAFHSYVGVGAVNVPCQQCGYPPEDHDNKEPAK
jgi:hypothetical protein